MIILAHLPPHLRHRAAVIYWQAFGGKLGRILGPEARGIAFLERAMRGDHCLCALDSGGDLLGLVGFKSAKGGFASGGPGDLTAVFGTFGAAWRATVLAAMVAEVDNENFLIDGICVAPWAQNRGVGRALITAICDRARDEGFAAIRLDVAGENHRARALYERMGFRLERSIPLGLFAPLIGVRQTDVMIRPLTLAGGA